MRPFKPVTFAALAAALAIASFSACSNSTEGANNQVATQSTTSTTGASGGGTAATTSATTTSAGAATTVTVNAADHDLAADTAFNEADVVEIALKGTTASSSSSAVKVNGGTVTITKAGTYRLTGTLANGQVVVDTKDDGTVKVVLNGVDITNGSNAAFAVNDAKKVVLLLAAGTQNKLTDAAKYVFADANTDEPNAALFSKADLTIAGTGSLDVDANYNDGIASKDGLVIAAGTISIDAADDGIRGKDYLVVKGGTVTVKAGGDGLKSDNEEEAGLGYVSIAAGTVTVTAAGDGIDAATNATVSGGTTTITSGGGSAAKISDDTSAKAIKGTASVTISNGTLKLDAADDAIHSNNAVTIDGGTISISTGDDGVHADAALTVNGGTIDIAKSYEGLESAAIVVNGGQVSLVASDDGLNAAGGSGGPGTVPGGAPVMGGQRPGQSAAAGNYSITINGGTILVTADGDGIDANGSVTMTNGTVVVQGPTANNNGAVDYDGTFMISGGTLVAAGSAGMAQAPAASSAQPSLLVKFSAAQKAGTLVHIQAADGTPIVTFETARAMQALVVSSKAITKDGSYDVFVGGTSTGTKLNGLYQGGTYAGGTKTATVTAVTTNASPFGGR
ncbi:MAG: carbohydrate-binding domain-containing protein [Dehalococcoidia bacterium]|nr:carbohydrate-binding domain-containing protein [Dehalococcoidia bacterium]